MQIGFRDFARGYCNDHHVAAADGRHGRATRVVVISGTEVATQVEAATAADMFVVANAGGQPRVAGGGRSCVAGRSRRLLVLVTISTVLFFLSVIAHFWASDKEPEPDRFRPKTDDFQKQSDEFLESDEEPDRAADDSVAVARIKLKKIKPPLIVPNIVHFVRFHQAEVTFTDMLCLMAAAKNLAADQILVHVDKWPTGPWWTMVKDMPGVRVVLRTSTPGQSSAAVHVDVLREYGGMFLDNDVFAVRPLDDVRRYPFSMLAVEHGHFGQSFG